MITFWMLPPERLRVGVSIDGVRMRKSRTRSRLRWAMAPKSRKMPRLMGGWV
jgi:hypothetical protein